MKGPSFSYIPRKQPWVRTERDEVPKIDNSFPSSFHPPSTPPPSASSRAGVYPHTPSSTHTLGWELFSNPECLLDSCAAKIRPR